MEQADEIGSLARDTRRLLVTNLMQRYNPLFSQIKALVDSKLLGDVLRGTFENYACDEGLGPDHWFWDRTKSGGIFIEHITLTSVPATKMTVYGDLLRAMLTDQLAFIAEPSHTRVITEDNGRESLRMSVRATQLASSSCA